MRRVSSERTAPIGVELLTTPATRTRRAVRSFEREGRRLRLVAVVVVVAAAAAVAAPRNRVFAAIAIVAAAAAVAAADVAVVVTASERTSGGPRHELMARARARRSLRLACGQQRCFKCASGGGKQMEIVIKTVGAFSIWIASRFFFVRRLVLMVDIRAFG